MEIKDCIVTDDFVFFWDSVFSQWYPAKFEVNGIEYDNAEQYMMYQKASLFKDEAAMHNILNCKSPAEAKSLGRQVRGYDEEVWNRARVGVVIRGNISKFEWNPDMRDTLISTGSRIIVEASPYDKIWGVGLDANDSRILSPSNWKGQNLLGYALVIVRSILR